MKEIGCVLEIRKDKVLIVTPDYNYILIKPKDPVSIGDMVLYSKSDIIEKTFRKKSYIKVAYIAASVLITLLIFVFFNENYYESEEVFAYISFEGNKNLEISVDKNCKVTGMGKNSDVKENRDKKITEYVSNIIRKKVSKEVLTDDNSVLVITISPKRETAELKYLNVLIDEIVNGIKTSKIMNDFFIYNLSKDQRKVAKEKDISMSKMKLFNLAKEKNINVSIESVKEENVNNLVDTIAEIGKEKDENQQNNNNNNNNNNNFAKMPKRDFMKNGIQDGYIEMPDEIVKKPDENFPKETWPNKQPNFFNRFRPAFSLNPHPAYTPTPQTSITQRNQYETMKPNPNFDKRRSRMGK